MFDLNVSKLLVLAVLALIIFGPEHLPKVASQAGRALRDLRRIAESAKADLQEGLGPEFKDFDISDLNPKAFVRKHLWEEFDGMGADATHPEPATVPPIPANGANGTSGASYPANGTTQAAGLLSPGESPPYDAEAT